MKTTKNFSRISLQTHFSLWIFTRSLPVPTFKACFTRICLSYRDYVICYVPFVFVFLITCSSFLLYIFDFSDKIINIYELFSLDL